MSSVDHLDRLLHAAAKGDVSAFEEFVKLTNTQVYGYVIGLVSKSQEEDVVQDTYMRLWKSRTSYDLHRSARTFLFTIAYRSSADSLRATSREAKNLDAIRLQIDRPIQAITPDESVLDLTTLTKEQRDVVLLVTVAGFSYAETAEIVGVKPQTVKSRLHEARKRLIEQLKSASKLDNLHKLA